MLVVAGEKPPPTCAAAKEEARFHLAERGFGRFARDRAAAGRVRRARAEATLDARRASRAGFRASTTVAASPIRIRMRSAS